MKVIYRSTSVVKPDLSHIYIRMQKIRFEGDILNVNYI